METVFSLRYSIIIVFLFITITSEAQRTTYYVSSSGSDGANGLTPATAWQTFANVTNLNNATIRFNRGNTFTGSLKINGNNDTIATYGSGAMPIFTGFTTLSFGSVVSGIAQAPCSSCTTNLNMVQVDGFQVPLCRWPNNQYRFFQSFTTNSITDSFLSDSVSFVGGNVVIRNNYDQIESVPILSQSHGTITFGSLPGPIATAGFGYFIQKDSLTLDTTYEWYLSQQGINQIKMYFGGSSPSSHIVKATTVDTVISIWQHHKNVVIDSIDIEGATLFGIYQDLDTACVTINCKANFCGACGWYNYRTYQCSAINCNMQQNNVWGMCNAYDASIPNTMALISHDTLNCNGNMIGQSFYDQSNGYKNIYSRGFLAVVEYVSSDTCGYDGIHTYWDSIGRYCDIKHFCRFMMDGGGWYHLGFTDTNAHHRLYKNVIHDGFTNPNYGTPTTNVFVEGIYVDAVNNNVIEDSNTVYNVPDGAYFIHDSRQITLTNNIAYNTGISLKIQGDDPTRPVNNIIAKHNQFGQANTIQQICNFSTYNGAYWISLPSILVDSNYYCTSYPTPYNLFGGSGTSPYNIITNYAGFGDSITSDQHSKLFIYPTSFQPNPTSSPLNNSFFVRYANVFGQTFLGTAIIPPFYSFVLFGDPLLGIGNHKKISR